VAGGKVEGANVEGGKVDGDGVWPKHSPAHDTPDSSSAARLLQPGAVAPTPGLVPHAAFAGLLENLAAHSLVKVVGGVDGEPRFGMLETIREFALERLRERGEEAQIQRRHTGCFLALAEEAAPELRSHDQIVWLDRMETEIDNFREAMRWTLARDSLETAARIAAALDSFWELRDYLPEGRRWLEALYLQRDQLAPQVRARLCHVLAWLRCLLGDGPAPTLYEESMQWYEQLGDTVAAARVGVDLGWYTIGIASEQARALLERGLATLEPAGDRLGASWALHGLALMATGNHNADRQRSLLEQSLALRRAAGDRQGIAWALVGLIQHALRCGDTVAARAFNADRLLLERELRHKYGEIACLLTFANIDAASGHYADALDHTSAAEQIAQHAAMEWEVIETRMQRAWLALRAGETAHATELASQVLNELRRFDRTLRYAHLIRGIGVHRLWIGFVTEASALIEEAFELDRTLGGDTRDDPFVFGCVAYHCGDFASAQTMFEQDLLLMRASGNPIAIADTLTWLGRTLTARGMPRAGLPHLRESITFLPHNHDLATPALEALAVCSSALGDQARAACLWGAAAIQRERLQCSMWPVDRPAYERDIAACRAALGDEAFDAAWQAGRALTWEQAVAEALALGDQITPPAKGEPLHATIPLDQ